MTQKFWLTWNFDILLGLIARLNNFEPVIRMKMKIFFVENNGTARSLSN